MVESSNSRTLATLVSLVAAVLVGGLGTAIAALSEQRQARQRDSQLATVALAAMSDRLTGVATSMSGVSGLAADGVVSTGEGIPTVCCAHLTAR